MCCETLCMAIVTRLEEAMKSGSQGMSSFLEEPADKTATSRRTSATAPVNGPTLEKVSKNSNTRAFTAYTHVTKGSRCRA